MSDKRSSSPNFNGKIFVNPVPTTVTESGTMIKVLRKTFSNRTGRAPVQQLGPFKVDLNKLKTTEASKLRTVWLGHSSMIIEIEGKKILTDPVYAKRASPFQMIGPKRFFDIPIALDNLPPLTAVIISHDHYDHLDKEAVIKLGKSGNQFICPLGVGERLVKWGISPEKVSELDWWEEIVVDGLKITAAPARHFSGRWITDRFKTLWASWAITGKEKNVFFGADSGLFPGFAEIGKRLGPFDLAMLEIGAYNLEFWPEIHMGPKNAIEAFKMLNSKLLHPIHWGTFNLALHLWKEPAEQIISFAEKEHIKLMLPAPGEIVEVNDSYISRWWEKY